MKILIFPFAGGSKFSFNNYFPNTFNVSVLDYPGRGLLIKEGLLLNINELVNNVFLQLQNKVNSNEDYILYGHSMGALVGYLICQKIEKSNLKKPFRFVVSGAKSPLFTRQKVISEMPTNEFWEEVSKLGGMPEEFDEHPELVEYFTPILKADFKCIENYQHDNKSPKLTIPIDVFYGSDEDITQEEAESWKEETTADVNVTQLVGNHFFIFDHKEYFRTYFKD